MGHASDVDIVITWVNGSDPLWRRRRARFRPDTVRSLHTSDVEGRYRCNDELRFLLRSIDRFWPMSGRIHIVTDQQVPDFLTHHTRLSVVDHREIIDPSFLPVFSSIAIEANLHRIPGLAEHFVAFNDDVFLTRPVGYDDFFGRHGSVVYLTDELLPPSCDLNTLSGQNSGINARNWIRERYGVSHVDHVIEHTPKGIRKSWMAELEAEDPAIFRAATQARFRDAGTQSILANLYGHWCLARGRGEIRRNAGVYLESSDIEHAPALDSLVPLTDGRLCLCLNDTTDNRDDVAALQARMADLLTGLFPDPSPWERVDRAPFGCAA